MKLTKVIALLENNKFWATIGTLAALLAPIIPPSVHKVGDEYLPVIFAIIHAFSSAAPPAPVA